MVGCLSVDSSEQDKRGSSRFRKCRQADRKERNVNRQTPGKDERRSIRYVCAVADVNGDNGSPRFPRQIAGRMLGDAWSSE
jgi:hypothetical protein